tara:strand:- start:16 stop:483 length:468 start_codon:yes stop_codon:yes gene_type:complete
MAFTTLTDKIREADLDPSSRVTLFMEEGGDVFHYLDSYKHDFVEGTSLAYVLAELVSDPRFKDNEYIKAMREEELLDDYERGLYEFHDYVAEVITENWFDYDWIETETEQYDYKRGFLTARVEFETTVQELLNSEMVLMGWEARVKHPHGTLEIS